MLRRHRGESPPQNIERRRESPDNTVRRSPEERGQHDSHLQRERASERAQERERDRVEHKQTPRRRSPSQDTVPFIAKVIELLGGGGAVERERGERKSERERERVRLCYSFSTDSIYQQRRKTRRSISFMLLFTCK